MVVDDGWLKELLEPRWFDPIASLIPVMTGLHPALTANRAAPELGKAGVKPAETAASIAPANRLPDEGKSRAAVARPKARTERQEALATRSAAPRRTEPPRKPTMVREHPNESGWQIRK
jgi:hypothetical protein